MERRRYLQSLGVAGLAGVAGCLDTLSGDDSDTILSEPDHPTQLSFHMHGEEFPSFSVPDPIADTTVSSDDLVGERPFLMTYFFTTCPDGACPALLLRLRWAQEDAIEKGYEDDISLLAFTFDPERDTADTLSEYAEAREIDYEADNWHFLRPEEYETAESLMTETFNMPLDRAEDMDELEEYESDLGVDDDDASHGGNGHDDGSHNESDGHDGDGHDDHDDHDDHDHGEYTFAHYNVITLVNEDGIVERAYPRAVQSEQAVDRDQLLEDVRAVVGVE
ncbi:SCO family protein [Natronolimnohabitans innermongolicus]|uniref:Thioredoxin domain-containing protein n=1 Tax=Natronolimnohabitans innermongolicus JCM 12255 TaxID=1227499 RepID=L9WH88_9EURY|nr:SCO family protein [Natronolimnohabitans innermongolicus]ELY48875.1 hypothetical protein C493_21346 [Natronolimnohabitans innermongolicus JCM 12255]